MGSKLAFNARVLILCLLAIQHGLICEGAQTSSRMHHSSMAIPARLRPSLDDGLQRFVRAQATDDWETIASLLGRYRGGARGELYTQAHKACLVTQMRSLPMVSFTTGEVLFSTEILSTPSGQRWWFLVGTAEFKTQSGIAKGRAQIIAYRDDGGWYFTPPNYDNVWVRARLTAADLAADLRDKIEVQLDPECPLAIRDLTVAIDPEYLSLRRIRFSLVNKTDKKVAGYSLRLGRLDSPCFGLLSGVPLAIDPRAEATAVEETYSGYTYYCEGEARRRLVIDSVSFSDGSTWTDPRFRRKRPPKDCLF